MKILLGTAAVALAGLGFYGSKSDSGPRVLASYRTSLEGRTPGQRHNAVRALGVINGVRIEPGATFSFNRRVGSWTRDQGYVKAPVSYSGQLIASWGGGVCQTSTTLYNAALRAGLVIDERHRHEFAPGYVPPGLDAAVAYETIDLKITNPWPIAVTIRTQRPNDAIAVDIVADRPVGPLPSVRNKVMAITPSRSFEMGRGPGLSVRTGGKSGYDVAVWRHWSDRDELISHDQYPVMHRLVERYDPSVLE